MNSLNKKVIALSGIDGSGKTTQARLLNYFLSKYVGMRTKTVWIKGNHTIAFILYKLLPSNHIVLFDNNVHTHTLFKSRLKKLWIMIEVLSVLVKVVLDIKISLRKRVVIADRYLLDTIVYLTTAINSIRIINYVSVKFLISLLVKDAKTILLDININELFNRKPALRKYKHIVAFRIALYRVLARRLGLDVVESTGRQVDVFKKILERLGCQP